MSPMDDQVYPPHGNVVATIDIAVLPERVFRALTDPEELAVWWVGIANFSVPGAHHWQVDARPRGRWSVTTIDVLGREVTIHGEYRVVDPPRALEFTWQASWDGFVTTTVRCELEPIIVSGTSGTRLRVIHTAPRAAVACAGTMHPRLSWNEALQSLRRYLGETPSRHQSTLARHHRCEIIA
jgi:uncharacterized protein YndB with AHSA1/START domain